MSPGPPPVRKIVSAGGPSILGSRFRRYRCDLWISARRWKARFLRNEPFGQRREGLNRQNGGNRQDGASVPGREHNGIERTGSNRLVSKTRLNQAGRWYAMETGNDLSERRGAGPCRWLARSVPRLACIDPAPRNPGPIRRTAEARSTLPSAYESCVAFACQVHRRLHSTTRF